MLALRRHAFLIAGLLAGCILLVNCGASTRGSIPVAMASPTEPVQAAPVIRFSRSGGLAGVSESWQVFADGRILDAAGRERHVAPEAVQAVLEQAQRSAFLTLSLRSPILSQCRDCFTYTLSISLATGSNTVIFEDRQKGLPPGLLDLVSSVQALVAAGA